MASEYVRHFTQRELVVGAGAEARLAKTLCQRVDLAGALAVAAAMTSASSCFVKAENHRAGITQEQLLEVLPLRSSFNPIPPGLAAAPLPRVLVPCPFYIYQFEEKQQPLEARSVSGTSRPSLAARPRLVSRQAPPAPPSLPSCGSWRSVPTRGGPLLRCLTIHCLRRTSHQTCALLRGHDLPRGVHRS